MPLQFPEYTQGLSFSDMLSGIRAMESQKLANQKTGAEIPGINAQTAQTLESTKLMPKDLDVKLISALNAREGNMIQRARLPFQNFMDSFGRLPETAKQNFIKNYPEIFDVMIKSSLTSAANGGNPEPAYYNNVESILGNDFPEAGGNPSQNTPYQPGVLNSISSNPQGAQLTANNAVNGGAQPLSSNAQDLVNTAKDKIIKDTVPAAIQDKRFYAENIQKTSAALNNYIDDAVQFGGHPFKWGEQEAKAIAGLPVSPQFQKAQAFYNLMPQWAGQVRQYYGDSIQPHVKKDLEQLAEPSFWRGNPQLARQKYEGIMSLLASERETTSSRPSQINDQTYNDKKSQQAAENSKKAFNSVGKDGRLITVPAGKVLVMSPDGKQGYIPESQLSAAMKQGYKKG